MDQNGSREPGSAASPTIAQTAYARLKDLIVTLVLPPGSTIHEPDLQRRIGVGRTPLREALHRLAHEGMLHIFPRRTSVVAKLGVSDVLQLFEARSVLEPAAASLAAERATVRDVEDLRVLGAGLREHRDRADVPTFLREDHCFHRQVARLARNALLADDIEHLLTLNLWLWHVHFDARGVRGGELFAHDPIIEAIAARDARAAEAAMREHVLCSKEQLLSGM
jgi:DNA-binding GntR family transcriptional regulator